LALFCSASAVADDVGTPSPEVRVLLLESSEPVRVRAPGADADTILKSTKNGIIANSQSVGPVWRGEGSGEARAAGLRLRGELEVRRVDGGLQVVNAVNLEDYVAGTVGREVYSGWEAEMLKAQAVAARTYALYERNRHTGRPYHLRRDATSQVYGGIAAENPAVLAAVGATRGEYLAWRGRPILAAYHSASGGQTASSEEVWGRALPYLVSLPVEGEEGSPDTYWRASVSGTTLGRALARLGIRVGPVREIRVIARSESGRAQRLAIRGARGTEELEARDLRTALGGSLLRSTLFEVRNGDDDFVFVGSGHGHGVGMSQWGGQAMASRGASYREILAIFYPGTEVAQ
jgi:stage II sporulation protein D